MSSSPIEPNSLLDSKASMPMSSLERSCTMPLSLSVKTELSLTLTVAVSDAAIPISENTQIIPTTSIKSIMPVRVANVYFRKSFIIVMLLMLTVQRYELFLFRTHFFAHFFVSKCQFGRFGTVLA